MLWAISCIDKPDSAAVREKNLAAVASAVAA